MITLITLGAIVLTLLVALTVMSVSVDRGVDVVSRVFGGEGSAGKRQTQAADIARRLQESP